MRQPSNATPSNLSLLLYYSQLHHHNAWFTMVNEQHIASALQDLQRRRYKSIRAAATAWNLNHATLARRQLQQLNRVQSHEPQQTLSSLQEGMLVRWILEAEQAGHAFNHAQLRDMASIIHRTSGGSGHIGKNWVPRFLQRHPEIKTKRGVSIANQRVNSLYSSTFSA